MHYIGIDPGYKNVGVAVLDSQLTCLAHDQFDLSNPLDSQRLRTLIRVYGDAAFATLEKVHAMPKQGVSSSFSFGKGAGIIEGILIALDIPYTAITPQSWMKVVLDSGSKSASIPHKHRALNYVSRMYPGLLKLKKHHNIADAICIARFSALKFNQEVRVAEAL